VVARLVVRRAVAVATGAPGVRVSSIAEPLPHRLYDRESIAMASTPARDQRGCM
jgi:hypothetical protein